MFKKAGDLMAPKAKSVFVCSQCGYESSKWFGKCPGCGEWNTFVEEVIETGKNPAAQNSVIVNTEKAVSLNSLDFEKEDRYLTGLNELDRVLGGGIVKGSLVLLSGDPGIGKSTLLLQISGFLDQNYKVLYVSGEESVRQIKLRAHRLGVKGDNLYIVSETDVGAINAMIEVEKPDIAIVDSIQTMCLRELSSSPVCLSGWMPARAPPADPPPVHQVSGPR